MLFFRIVFLTLSRRKIVYPIVSRRMNNDNRKIDSIVSHVNKMILNAISNRKRRRIEFSTFVENLLLIHTVNYFRHGWIIKQGEKR